MVMDVRLITAGILTRSVAAGLCMSRVQQISFGGGGQLVPLLAGIEARSTLLDMGLEVANLTRSFCTSESFTSSGIAARPGSRILLKTDWKHSS